ncbi:hypothetical protein D9M71_497270 [compost metagenome]
MHRNRVDAGRLVGAQRRVVLDLQATGRQVAAFQVIFAGVPPDHFLARQFQPAAVGRHQRFALFTHAEQAAVVDLVAQLRLVRVAAQAGHFGGRQRWQLGAGQAFGLHRHGPGQGVADLGLLLRRVGAPVFFQAQVAGRQPGRIGRVIGGDRVDRQHQRRGVDTYLFAGPGGIEFLLGIILCSRGAERQRRDVEVAALLRVDRIAHFDHPVAHTVDILLEGTRFTQRLDPGVVDLQRAQAAVIVQRHRVIDAQGQYRLGLHVDFGLIEAGIDEHRAVVLVAGLLSEDLQTDRLAT